MVNPQIHQSSSFHYPIRLITESDIQAYDTFMTAISAEEMDLPVPARSISDIAQVKQFIAAHTGDCAAIFLAENEGQIVGTINLTKFVWPQLDHVVWLSLNVASGYRNKGIGKSLLACGLQWASQVKRIERLELEVLANNYPAIHLYESFGFVREGVKRSAVKRDDLYLDIVIYGLLPKKVKPDVDTIQENNSHNMA